MNNERNNWHSLSDRIAEKVDEYLQEAHEWEGDTFLWVDGNTGEVNLGSDNDDYSGEKNHIHDFITVGDDGNLFPDYDKIDDYSSSWFNLRL